MNKKLGASIVLIILIINIILFLPYLFKDYNFLIGSDSGKYTHELNNYLNGESYKNTISIWEEPGMYIFLENISLFITQNPFYLFLIYQIICGSLIILFSFIIISKFQKSTSASLIAGFLVGTSVIYLNSFFHGFYRQQLGIVFSLIIIFILENYELSKKNMVMGSVLFGFLLITHRATALILFIVLFLYGAYCIFKKENNKCKKIYFLMGLSILVSLPYYLINLGSNITMLKDSIYNRICVL